MLSFLVLWTKWLYMPHTLDTAFVSLTPGVTFLSASGANLNSTAVPEPNSLLLLGSGFLAYAVWKRRGHQ